MNKGFKYWLRWLAVLPGALLAGIAAGFLLHWMLYVTFMGGPMDEGLIQMRSYPELPERLLFPFVFAAIFVWAGSRIAPEHKVKTSILLFGLLMLLMGAFVFLALSGTSYMGGQVYLHARGIGPIMAIAGAFLGLRLVRKQNPKAPGNNHK